MSTEKKKPGPRLPYGQLGGLWSEVKRVYCDQQEGRIPPDDARALPDAEPP